MFLDLSQALLGSKSSAPWECQRFGKTRKKFERLEAAKIVFVVVVALRQVTYVVGEPYLASDTVVLMTAIMSFVESGQRKHGMTWNKGDWNVLVI
jgi:hypothetical protein